MLQGSVTVMAKPMEVGCGGKPGKQAGQKANRSNPLNP